MKPTTTDTQTQEAVLKKLNQLQINQFYKIYNAIGGGEDDEKKRKGLIALRNETAQQPESGIHKVLTSLFKSESGHTDEIRTDIKWKELIRQSQEKHEQTVKHALESLDKNKFDAIYGAYKKNGAALQKALTQNLSKTAMKKKMASPDLLAVWKALLGAKQQELQSVKDIDCAGTLKTEPKQQEATAVVQTLESIKKRNNTGYLFQENDIYTLVTALQKKNEIPSERCILIPGITTDQRMRNSMTIMLRNLPSHEDQQGKPLKVAIPFQLEGQNHWNLITATFEVNKDIILREQNTDGQSKGIEDWLLDEFKRVFEEKGYTKDNGYGDIKTLSSTEKTYSFPGQRGINCGIVTALMAYDYFVQKRDYAGIITSNKSDGVIRDEVSTIVFEHAEELQKVKFCQPQTSNVEVAPGAIESFKKTETNLAILDKLNTLRIDQFYQIFNAIVGAKDINDVQEQISRLRALREKTASQQESELHKVLSNLFKSEPNDTNQIRSDIECIPLIYASHNAHEAGMKKALAALDKGAFSAIYSAYKSPDESELEKALADNLTKTTQAEKSMASTGLLTLCKTLIEVEQQELREMVISELDGLGLDTCIEIYEALETNRDENKEALIQKYRQSIQKAEIERLDWEMLTERLKENLSQQVLKVLSGLNFAKIEAIYYASTLERESEQHEKLVELYAQKNFKEIGFLFKDKRNPSKGFINLDWRVPVEQAYQSKKTAQGNNLLATSIGQDLLNIFKNPNLYILLLIGALGFWKFGLLGAIVGISLSINVIQLIDIIERKLELEPIDIEDQVESSTLGREDGANYFDIREKKGIDETPFLPHTKGV